MGIVQRAMRTNVGPQISSSVLLNVAIRHMHVGNEVVPTKWPPSFDAMLTLLVLERGRFTKGRTMTVRLGFEAYDWGKTPGVLPKVPSLAHHFTSVHKRQSRSDFF